MVLLDFKELLSLKQYIIKVLTWYLMSLTWEEEKYLKMLKFGCVGSFGGFWTSEGILLA